MFGSSSGITMTFNSRLKRVRVEFLAKECFAHWKPPRDLVLKVEEKFREERSEGHIETYLVFGRRFEEFWAHIRDQKGSIPEDRRIKFTIGQGGRIYDEIQIRRDGQGELRISCQFLPKKMSTIPFNAFLFNVLRNLDRLAPNFAPDRAQLKFYYLMLKNGQALDSLAIWPAPSAEDNTRDGFAIRIHPDLRYASLHVFDPNWLSDESNSRSLLDRAHEVFLKLNKQQIPMHFLDSHSREKLQSLNSKMQAFGFQMPYDLLIAYDEANSLNPKLMTHDRVRESDLFSSGPMRLKPSYRRVQGDFLQIDMDPERMSATLVGLREKPSRFLPTLTFEDLAAEIRKSGVVFGYEPYIQDLWDKLQAHQNVAGLLVAKGAESEPGKSLTLVMVNDEAAEGDATLDVRERQNTRLVRKGSLVAEVRYRDGIAGHRVDGHSFQTRGSASELGLKVGDGIRLVGDGQFFATRDGLLELADDTLSCQTAYVHKGSINLASGNLRFEGAVVIEGDIEAGATVEITGPLLVNGSIQNAHVSCTGDLEVKGGINTGKDGYVHVGGKAQANFIENSVIHVRDSLLVQISISHSLVISGGLIHVQDENRGLIVGGMLAAWQAIVAARVGLSQGQGTQIRLGSHYLEEIRLQRLKKRLRDFEKAAENNERSIAVFEKPGVHLNADQKVRYDYVKGNAQRYESILKTIKDALHKHSHNMNYNEDATLVVKDVLDKNSQVSIAGRNFPVPTSMQGILVTAHLNDGFLDLKEAKRFQGLHPKAVVA